MADSISFSFPGDDSDQRRAFRAKVPGLEAWVPHLRKAYPVHDISASGLAVLDAETEFQEGETFQFDLLLNRKLFISGLTATVIRRLQNGVIGCNFAELDPKQEARMDKLVLEVQKRLIALKKAKG